MSLLEWALIVFGSFALIFGIYIVLCAPRAYKQMIEHLRRIPSSPPDYHH